MLTPDSFSVLTPLPSSLTTISLLFLNSNSSYLAGLSLSLPRRFGSFLSISPPPPTHTVIRSCFLLQDVPTTFF